MTTKSVLIAVFDGLQPAQVRPELAPNLARFADEGVFFENHHPVFPSVTRVNAASMVTGRQPGGHGLAANVMVARDFDPSRVFSALEPTLEELRRATGKALLAPTLADILAACGLEYVAVGVGTSGNAYVHNPNADAAGGATIHPDFTLPRELGAALESRFGAWASESLPNTARFNRAIDILTEYVLAERTPAVSLIWSSEPDKSQHAAGVGSEMSDRAVREADAGFGRILNRLDALGLSESADILVASDHGYSTIREVVDVEWYARDAGFGADEVLVAPNGGCALFYARDSGVARRLAAWLMGKAWSGAVLASERVGAVEGALPLSLVGGEGPRGPDVVMSFDWDSRANAAGYRGFAHSTGGAPGLGQHGSMSRYEMNNVLLARGPSFLGGARIASPTGNADVAPTVLRLLGLPIPADMEGRIISEALADGGGAVEWTSEIHSAERVLESGARYCQRIRVSRAGGAFYVDEGSGTRG